MPHQEQKNEARIGGSGLNAGLGYALCDNRCNDKSHPDYYHDNCAKCPGNYHLADKECSHASTKPTHFGDRVIEHTCDRCGCYWNVLASPNPLASTACWSGT